MVEVSSDFISAFNKIIPLSCFSLLNVSQTGALLAGEV